MRWAVLAVAALFVGQGPLTAQFRDPNIISANVDAGSYCLGMDLFENLHIAYVTEGVLNLHTLLADGRVTDLLVAADSAQPDLDFFSVSLHLSYLHRSVPVDGKEPGSEVWYSAQIGQALRQPERVSREGESCLHPAIELDRRGNPHFAWETLTSDGETRIQLARIGDRIADLGPGTNPDLVIDSQGKIHAFFLRDGVIHYTHDAESAVARTFPAAEPITGRIPGPHSPPRAAMTNGSGIYLAYSAGGELHLANNEKGSFDRTALIDSEGAQSPSLHVDPRNNLSISYQKNGDIYHLWGTPGDLSAPQRIIGSPENELAPENFTDSFGNHPVVFVRNSSLYMTTDARPPEAAFSITRSSGVAPLEVQMIDESSGDLTSWLWSFGDGSFSLLREPVHTYEEPGEYRVRLNVNGPGGSSATEAEQIVQVIESQNRMWIEDVRVYPGLEGVYIPVGLSHDAPVQALQVAATFDPRFIEVIDVDFLLGDLRHLNPELLAFNISNDPELPYVTSGIIFDIEPPYDGRTLAPGTQQRILNIVADISPLAPEEGSALIRLSNGAGEPPLENILTVNSQTVQPRIEERGTVFFEPAEMSTQAFVRGDTNGNGLVNISDAVVLLGYLFLGGEPVTCIDAADSNDSGRVNVADAAYILNFLFRGGAMLPPPYPNPALDPTADALSCSQ